MRTKKQKIARGFMATTLLLSLPALLIACGNPLNGEKLRLWGPPPEKHVDGPAGPGQVPGQPGTSPKPGASAAPACVPQTNGSLDPNDPDVIAFNKAVDDIEKTKPRAETLSELIRDFVGPNQANLGLKPEVLKSLRDQILAFSPRASGIGADASDSSSEASESPQPAPNSKPSIVGAVSAPLSGAGLPQPRPVDAPSAGDESGVPIETTALSAPPASPAPTEMSPLHSSIVAFVAFKAAITFAQGGGSDQLGFAKKDDVIDFGRKAVTYGHHDQAVLAYKKVYVILTKNSYKPEDAVTFLKKLFGHSADNRIKLVLHWLLRYNLDSGILGFQAALKNADDEICFNPDAKDDKGPPRAVKR